MRLIITSLSRPNIRYAIDKNRGYEYTRFAAAVEWAREFDTLGDGNTQHTPESMIAEHNLGDFCASVAQFLFDNPEHTTVVAELYRGSIARRSEVAFYASVRYDEEKKQYLNRHEQKLSRAASKQHDKRWEEVVPWMDGSLKAVYGLIVQGIPYDALRKFLTLSDIGDMGDFFVNEEKFLNLPDGTGAVVRALRNIINAHSDMKWAHTHLDAYIAHTKLKEEAA